MKPESVAMMVGAVIVAAAGSRRVRSRWEPPAAATHYLPAIRTAEAVNGLPRNMLAGLLYQESRYREDIISGEVVSSAGAVGIAQIVPRWHPDVDPLDPVAAIAYAGRYLRGLYEQFEFSWPHALAAYNWGPGNLSRQGIGNAPAETREYIDDIMARAEV